LPAPPVGGKDAAMRVLIVEDEDKIARAIERVLTAEHHAADVAPDGVTGLALASQHEYQVILLDRMLPDLDGLEVLRLLRSRGVGTPVLMLTALGTLDHRISGLDAGADDYLAKPFAFSEMLARIRALARRAPAPADEHLVAGDLVLDPLRVRVSVGDRSQDLSAREFALLSYLIRHADEVVTRQQILDAVWGADPDVYSNVVDLYVHYLRDKLEVLGRREVLRTVRGVGYSLRTDAAA
jgi:two-component system OmpR family response regulator